MKGCAMGNYYGYMRISTKEERAKQKYARQEKSLETYAKNNNIDYVLLFREDISGKSFSDRAEWQRVEKIVKKGDTVVFKDICRFSREAENGFRKYCELMDKGINLVFIDNPTLNTDYIKNLFRIADEQDRIARESTRFIGRILLIAELERAERERLYISQRTKDGMAASPNKAGRKPGHLDKMTPELKADIVRLLADRNLKMVDVMRKHKITRNTLKKYMDHVKNSM